jgi:uncharacterized cupin superfamily protein
MGSMDLTYAVIDEMETNDNGVARKARATLGVTAFGMQVMDLPAGWDAYPDHNHADAGQEEVYVPLSGSGTLIADDHEFELRPGVMVRVGPAQNRKVVPGEDGIRFLALGGVVGAHEPLEWTELR